MSILDLRGHLNILILIDYKNRTISKANFLFYTDKKSSQILHIPKHCKLDHSVFVVALKKNSRKKIMVRIEFVAKLNYLCSNIQFIEDYFIFSEDINKNLWCADGEDHSPKCCGRVFLNIKWFLPVLAGFKKDMPTETKLCLLLCIVLKTTLWLKD